MCIRDTAGARHLLAAVGSLLRSAVLETFGGVFSLLGGESPGGGEERGVNLGLLLVGHVALTVAAYLTRRPEAAIAAGLMNFPLLRTVFLIKRLDDAMAGVVQS